MGDHIVKSFDEDLKLLKKEISTMGRRAGTLLTRAIQAVRERNPDLAEQVIHEDRELDELDRSVSKAAIRLLALRQPVAIDLREGIAAIRIASDLERCGDLAKNIAKRADVLARFPGVNHLERLARMANDVHEQLSIVMHAYTDADVEAARGVWERDREIDDVYNGLFREYLTYMMEDPRTISLYAHSLFMAKNVERIGDHCANIAASVYYLLTGDMLVEDRPKGADTNVTIVEPVARLEPKG
jgi:phosphate transport system protein